MQRLSSLCFLCSDTLPVERAAPNALLGNDRESPLESLPVPLDNRKEDVGFVSARQVLEPQQDDASSTELAAVHKLSKVLVNRNENGFSLVCSPQHLRIG